MSASRNRVVMVAVVAAVALLAVGATAYSAEQGQSAGTSAAGERAGGTGTSAVPTPSAPAPEPSPSASATTVPAPQSTQAAVEPEDVSADSGVEGDGNVVEGRTPTPDAIPTTIAQREYFYGLVTQCMAEAGFDWQAVVSETNGSFSGVSFTHVGDIDPALQAGFTLALYGDTGSGDDYHWADAGCWGYAVHTTGNDGNN